ncbi:MAG: isocitrate dehydrogenase kinase/phosphatase AceK regulatory subunit, partial [Myxococcota bacterium]
MELAEHAAELILSYLKRYRKEFKEMSRSAKGWFETRDWPAAREGLTRRTDLYSRTVTELVRALQVKMGAAYRDRAVWKPLKRAYARDIANRADEEIAETFFNSVTREVFKTTGFDRELEFVWIDNTILPSGEESPVFRSWYPIVGLPDLFGELFESLEFASPWRDLGGDATRVASRILSHLQERSGMADFDVVETFEPILYRSKGAYLVGRIRRGHRIVPLVIA